MSNSCLGKWSSSCEKMIRPSCMICRLPQKCGNSMAESPDQIEIENGRKRGCVLDIQHVMSRFKKFNRTAVSSGAESPLHRRKVGGGDRWRERQVKCNTLGLPP